MKFEISISEAAKSELREAFLWYEDQLMNLKFLLKKTTFLIGLNNFSPSRF